MRLVVSAADPVRALLALVRGESTRRITAARASRCQRRNNRCKFSPRRARARFATSSESSRSASRPASSSARRRVRGNHPLVLLALIFPVADRAALLLGLDGAPELSSAFCVAALGLERCEHGEPVYRAAADREADGGRASPSRGQRSASSERPTPAATSAKSRSLPPCHQEKPTSAATSTDCSSNSMAWAGVPLFECDRPQCRKCKCLLPAVPQPCSRTCLLR